MIVDVLVALSCGLVGLLCGWLIYPTMNVPTVEMDDPLPQGETPTPTAAGTPPSDEERERLNQIADRFRSLNARVAADVNAHQTRIREVSDSLLNVDLSSEPELILEAMHRLLDASEQMQDQLEQAEDRLQEQSLQLQTAEQRAMTDALTRLANRGALDDHLRARAELGAAHPTTMMLFDIDHFKKFNDSYGHLAGDEVLRVVAKMVQSRCQEDCMVARYGGEEFAIVFNDRTLEDCQIEAEEIRASIGQREVQFEDQCFRVTASAGVAQLEAGESIEEWIARADKALYASKEANRNCGHAMDGDQPTRIYLPEPTPVLRSRKGSARSEESANGSEGVADVLPDYLQRLPTGKKLQAEFSELFTGLTGVGVAFVTAVVRLDSDNADPRDLQITARTVRSAVRSVDRIGLLDRRTLVVGMPSVDRDLAIQRADDIRMSLTQATHDNASQSPVTATVSVSLTSSQNAGSFDEMLEAAIANLENAVSEGPNQTVVEWNLPAASV